MSTSSRYILEHFEGVWAVLETGVGETLDVPRTWLPEGVGEGDVLAVSLERDSRESVVRFTLDAAATDERRRAAGELRESLPRAPEGDLEL